MEAVRLMSSVADKYNRAVKAAGGIRTRQDAIDMLEAGAYPLSGVSLYPSCVRLVSEQVMVAKSCDCGNVFVIHDCCYKNNPSNNTNSHYSPARNSFPLEHCFGSIALNTYLFFGVCL